MSNHIHIVNWMKWINQSWLITVWNETPSTEFLYVLQHKMVQVLDGENLLGGTPLVEQLDLLTTGMEGCVTPEELEQLVAMFCPSVDIPCSWNAGVTGLPLCKAGFSMSGNIVGKLLGLLEGLYYDKFLSLLSYSTSKWEGSDLGLILWWVPLRMELSGNIMQ